MEPDSDLIEDEHEDMDGSIVNIHVRNFFCHDNLEVNLNKNVNFIIGRNGSGKSAILTALVVGLGGRASATNRGSNLRSFIKKGANSATIEIKIKNSSPRAYKHNIYGDYITIVRHINASGGSSYKVKTASGEIASTKFEEVNAITLAHDIQVDNPISVLNQDDARSFHASNAKKKYALFRKATNLDQAENNYRVAIDNCNKADSIRKRKEEACKDLEQEYKKWKTSHEQLRSHDQIKERQKALQNEYYWSEIAELEREANKIQEQYDKQKVKMDKLRDKLSAMTQNYGNNTSAIDELQKSLDEKTLQKTALEQELNALETEVKSVQATWRSSQNNAGKITDSLNREKRKIQDLEREIQNIGSGAAESRRAELEARAQRAAAAADAVRARYATAQHEAEQARDYVAHTQAQAEQLSKHKQQQQGKLSQLKQTLRELESRGNDSLAVYGNNMVELCQQINAAVARKQFSQKPRGPVGAYLKVKEKKWGGALEHIIGGSIQAFCVNTPEDSRKLFQLMDQVYGSRPKPSVTCSKFLARAHDVRNTRVRAGAFRSALDSLDISDPVIANFLIDNVGMEKVLLVPDHDDAVRLSDNEENVPENCAKIVTLDSTEYHPAPNYRSYGGAARTSRFLHLSTAERKKQVIAEVKEAEIAVADVEAKAEELSREAAQARVVERTAARALQALLRERHEKDEEARVAAVALDQQQAPQHAVLVEELEISKEKMVTLQRQVDELSSKDSGYRQQLDEYDVRMKKSKKQLAELRTSCRSLREEIDQEQLKLEQGVTERRTYEQRLREDSIKMTQVEAILEDKRGVIRQKVEDAEQLCPRVPRPRDTAIVTNELKKIQLKLSAIRSDGLSEADVTARLLDAEHKYRATRNSLERLKKLVQETEVVTKDHLKHLYNIQIKIASLVQLSFQSRLRLRGFSGRMEIDHGEGSLEIQCSGRESSQRRAAASTASLSGGERSYSTVAFIMALWDCVQLPFYFMDEFDVFMDNVNRKTVMRMLIDYALGKASRQFVFLTPQDTSNVSAQPKISIHRMADPRP
ncbi:hypothetical protein PYW07_006862 [Mythimna separata]|uniref:RecF/RecN/SMC N-terminal domain-containing protein n=1 Tax=Mythimna separata TaxID=271217 RepID=A0AAD7Z0V9_MYTSE|nr:hypothetical protein PYW07_006862 [Mythimna separata]